jgi:hypothetical protein
MARSRATGVASQAAWYTSGSPPPAAAGRDAGEDTRRGARGALLAHPDARRPVPASAAPCPSPRPSHGRMGMRAARKAAASMIEAKPSI